MPRATPAPAPPLPGLALASPSFSTSRCRRPSCHVFRRCCPLQLTRVVPLFALRHAQQLLPDLLNPRKGSLSTTTPSPEHSSSPEHCRSSYSPSSATYAASRLRFSAPAAPRDPQKLTEQTNSSLLHLNSRTAAPASSSSAAAQPRRRLAATEPLSPSQGHQQHHINP
jgi:hypothetical protein